ncbi:MAG TPA: chromosome partitioning protein [Clostridiaceae bacterium]|nr:chromosome partitioning protein [Clostridiaceae bacterium]
MQILNLVVADTDKLYAESLTNFLSLYSHQKFQVSCFTKLHGLIEFLAGNDRKVDILLISSDLFTDEIKLDCANTVIILTKGEINGKVNGFYSINKYQNADIIANKITGIFSEGDKHNILPVHERKKAKVIAVYSPIGSSGKTCMAVSLSIQSARRGMTVLYLNFENVQTTPLLFNTSYEVSLSDLLYHIKDPGSKLHLKIEGTRCIDPETRIHYFAPPDRLTELEEITPDEIRRFIKELRAMGQYDLVFLDMSSSFNMFNIALLEECDEIFYVSLQDRVSRLKAGLVLNEMRLLSERNGYPLFDKITFILNKWKADMPVEREESYFENEIRLPFCEEIALEVSKNTLSSMTNNFCKSIGLLLGEKVLRGFGDEYAAV